MTITRLVTLTKQIVSNPGFCHSPQDVHPIVEHIAQMNPALLGLENHRYTKKRKRGSKSRQKSSEELDTILYQHIFEDVNISVGIFILPKNSVLPLHDHPMMSVVTLGLFGSCRLVSYDWKTEEARNAQQGEATLVLDKIMRPGDVAVCHPRSHGNIHSIQAVENFAMLDILIPPYGENRLCRYFEVSSLPKDISASSDNNDSSASNNSETSQWLQPIPDPFLKLEHELYLGPPVDLTQLRGCAPPIANPQPHYIDETA
eukprot:c26039_g1_i1.p1 GENE.c26039_g1_i1~~c26039_g1_i1.p1  ORF type:complete len:259 (-),score=18.18 c26039_g1_i1:212-988(-)